MRKPHGSSLREAFRWFSYQVVVRKAYINLLNNLIVTMTAPVMSRA